VGGCMPSWAIGHTGIGRGGFIILARLVMLLWRKRAVLPWDVIVWVAWPWFGIWILAFISGAFYSIPEWRPPARYAVSGDACLSAGSYAHGWWRRSSPEALVANPRQLYR